QIMQTFSSFYFLVYFYLAFLPRYWFRLKNKVGFKVDGSADFLSALTRSVRKAKNKNVPGNPTRLVQSLQISGSLCHSNILAQINVLDRVQQFHAFVHRALESFAAGDKSGAAAAFVDHRRAHCIGQIAGAL